MRRRDFITGLLLTTAVPSSQAQQPRKVHRIGFLWLGAPGTDDTPRQGLVQGLRALGYVEGENLIIEYRYAGERPERLPELAAELVRLNVDLIRTPGTLATRAAQQATRIIPIVTTAADLVSNGFVASLARPGGNVTGVSLSSGPEIAGKRLQILKEVRPDMQWVGYLWERDNPGSATDLTYLEQISRDFHVSVKAISVSRSEEIESAFAVLEKAGVGGLILDTSPLITGRSSAVISLAEHYRMPTISGRPEYVTAGGLMAYGVYLPDVLRRTASYVDRILKGAKPGDLPVEQPTRFELIINLKAARTLGVNIPPPLLATADQVTD